MMLSTASVPAKELSDTGADDFGWADDGKAITWTVGASVFRQPLSAISFEPPKEEKKEGEKKEDTKKEGDKKEAPPAHAKRDETKKDEQAEKKPEKSKERENTVEEHAVNLELRPKTPKGTA